MISFLCQVLVEVPEEQYKDWSEHADIMFHSDVGELHNGTTQFLVSYVEVKNDSIPKYECFTKDGGV